MRARLAIATAGRCILLLYRIMGWDRDIRHEHWELGHGNPHLHLRFFDPAHLHGEGTGGGMT